MPWSAQIHTKFRVHRVTQVVTRLAQVFGYGAITLFGQTFQTVILTVALPYCGPTTPPGYIPTVWASPLSLATTNGIDSLSFPVDTEMFHFSTYCSTETIDSSRSNIELPMLGFPIRIPPDQSVCAAPRRFSQLTASFIA